MPFHSHLRAHRGFVGLFRRLNAVQQEALEVLDLQDLVISRLLTIDGILQRHWLRLGLRRLRHPARQGNMR